MELIKITELTSQLGISSRTLRYYEQMGLLKSERLPLLHHPQLQQAKAV